MSAAASAITPILFLIIKNISLREEATGIVVSGFSGVCCAVRGWKRADELDREELQPFARDNTTSTGDGQDTDENALPSSPRRLTIRNNNSCLTFAAQDLNAVARLQTGVGNFARLDVLQIVFDGDETTVCALPRDAYATIRRVD